MLTLDDVMLSDDSDYEADEWGEFGPKNAAAVAVGPNVTLLFTDSEEDAAADAAMVGVHIAVYIANYTHTVEALHAAGQ